MLKLIFFEYLGIIRLYEGLGRSYCVKCSVVKKDLETLGTTGQEEILNYLEEVIVLGSFAPKLLTRLKRTDFPRENSAPTVGMRKY